MVSTPNTEISSSFISLLTDICEENSTMTDIVKRSEYLVKAISFCLPLNEVNVQSDAQFLYNTFNLISVILDGCDDAPGFAEILLKNTEIISLIKRQFRRDDFDDNVLAATETLAILLQIQPNFISDEEQYRTPPASNENDSDGEDVEGGNEELLNLLLRFIANEKNPKSSSEDEAAHNGFNALTLFTLNEKGIELFVQLKGIEYLLDCWTSKAKTAMLAVKAIETALAASTPCCIQFIDAGGLERLTKTLKDPKTLTSKKISSSIIGILDALLTMLPTGETKKAESKDDSKEDSTSDTKEKEQEDSSDSLDPEGKYFRMVLKIFEKKKKNEYKRITKLIKISEFIFENASDDEAESMDVFQTCACCIAILSGYASNNVRIQIFEDVNNSDNLDFQLIIDSAELRIEDAKSIAHRVEMGLETLAEFIDIVE